MTSWPLCAPLSLISFAGFLLFPVIQIEFCKFIKDLFLFPRVVPSACYFPVSSLFHSLKSLNVFFSLAAVSGQSISKTSQLFLCRPPVINHSLISLSLHNALDLSHSSHRTLEKSSCINTGNVLGHLHFYFHLPTCISTWA